MFGPGKYDDVCTALRTMLEARGVVLIVVEGAIGSGFSAQLTPEDAKQLPDVLRAMLAVIEADVKKAHSSDN